jgi:beta-mannosidase
LVQASFGDRIEDLTTLGLASQFLQRDGLAYAVEAHRRRSPYCVGTLPWQFNEPYPNAWCTSAVTHAGEPKPAYYGVAAAYRSTLVGAICSRQSWSGSTSVRLPLWALSEHPLEAASLTARVLTLSGKELAALDVHDLPVGPTAAVVGELCFPTPPGAFVVDLRLTQASTLQASRRYLLTGATDFAELLDGQAELDISLTGGQLIIRHLAGPAAPFVRVRDGRAQQDDSTGWLHPSDSGFVVLPGEERAVDLQWRHAGTTRLVAVDGLRLLERLIRCP